MNIATLGEFGLIGRIAERARVTEGVRCGIGDDAAALEPSPGMLQLITSDMLLEGVHFDLSYSLPEILGRKALAVNLSDIASMGGIPRWFLLSLALPPATNLEFIDPFMNGMLEIAAQYGVSLIGGDTCSSRSDLVISITLIGEQFPEKVVYRRGASPGDLICVTGTPGDSALGLLELKTGIRDGFAVSRHLDPTPRCSVGVMLAQEGIPSAMIDVSDGLLGDVGHILEQSRVGARIEIDRLPLSEYFRKHAGTYCDDLPGLALSGGEDYELLFTVPPARWPNAEKLLSQAEHSVTVIGEVTASGGLQTFRSDGELYRSDNPGYRHF